MNTIKNMAMVALGATGMLVYQKYKKPVTKAVKKAFNKEAKMINNTLEDMM